MPQKKQPTTATTTFLDNAIFMHHPPHHHHPHTHQPHEPRSSSAKMTRKRINGHKTTTTSAIAKRNENLHIDFGFGCNLEEHVKYGKVLIP
jgi:hypothetical protein